MPIFNRHEPSTRAIQCVVNASISLASDVLPAIIPHWETLCALMIRSPRIAAIESQINNITKVNDHWNISEITPAAVSRRLVRVALVF
jgi:hypothetical protein